MKHSAILWPDHAIGKRESRAIREAHNALYNDFHEALEALRAYVSKADDMQRIAAATGTAPCLHTVGDAAAARALIRRIETP